MKKVLFVAVIVALFASVSIAQEKTYDVPGVFTFHYPDGWTKGPRKGGTPGELDWLVSSGNANASFHAVIARADFSYDDWIRRSIKTASPTRVLAAKGDFQTTGGQKGYKLTWNIKMPNGQEFVTYNYLFSGKGDTQVQLSGTVDATQAAQFEPVFDSFAKSFALTKAK